VNLGVGLNRLARRRSPNGREGRPAPLGAGGESTARSRIACRGRYGVSRLLGLQRWGDEGQGLGHLAEVKHTLDGPGAGTDHQAHLLCLGPAGKLEDETDADDVDEAQSAEIEDDALGIAGQRPSDRVPEACSRAEVAGAVKLEAGGRSSLRDGDPQT
jgi:hypothetical protein